MVPNLDANGPSMDVLPPYENRLRVLTRGVFYWCQVGLILLP